MVETKITDSELISVLAQNKKKGFELLYKQCSCLLYGFILRAVEDPTIASDILMNTFANAYRQWDVYDRTKQSIFTWIMNISRDLIRSANTCNDCEQTYELVLYRGMSCEQVSTMVNIPIHKIQTELRKALQTKRKSSL